MTIEPSDGGRLALGKLAALVNAVVDTEGDVAEDFPGRFRIPGPAGYLLAGRESEQDFPAIDVAAKANGVAVGESDDFHGLRCLRLMRIRIARTRAASIAAPA
jgi:hypothetical protein